MARRESPAAQLPLTRTCRLESLEDRRMLSGNGSVTDRLVFYNNSAFGTTSPATKSAFQSGDGTITSASMTSYSRGLNGIAVNITDAPGPLSLSDFEFKMSDQGFGPLNTNQPSTWDTAPEATSFTVITDSPVAGTDRVEITFEDNAIENRYLEVRTLANADTGLGADDVFYYGNIIGDTFNPGAPTVWLTTPADETAIQAAIVSVAPIDSLLDMDKNGIHLASDRLVPRSNSQCALNKLADPLTPPSARIDAAHAAMSSSTGCSRTLHVDLTFVDAGGSTLPDDQEVNPGGFLLLNDDDDDDDGTPDFIDDIIPGGDNDLAKLRLSVSLPSGEDVPPGTLTLSFSAHVNIWRDQEKNDEVLSGTEFDVTSEHTLYVEGVSVSTELTHNFVSADYTPDDPDELADGGDSVRVTVVDVDLGVDSNNDGTIDNADDLIEDITGDDLFPGQVINVSNIDTDGDGILDWVDGFDWRTGDTEDDSSPGTSFAPLQLTLPAWLDFDETDIEILYDDSDPRIYRPGDVLGRHFERPDDGTLRIWTKDSSESRDPEDVATGGDFVPSGTHTAASLGITSASTTLYLEAVNPSDSTATQAITIRVSGGGLGSGLDLEDQVRVTTTLIEIIANSSAEGLPPFEVFGFVASRLPHYDAQGRAQFNDYLQTYTINVYDPRATISEVRVEGQPVPLVRQGDRYTTPNPVIAILEADAPLLAANELVTIQNNYIRQRRYAGFFEPDDPFAGPTAWNVTSSGGPVVLADLESGLLHVNTIGQSTYSAEITDADLWSPSEAVNGTIRFRLLNHDTVNGPDGAFALVLGDGIREWWIGVAPDKLITYSNGLRVETALAATLLDGGFHSLAFERTGDFMIIRIDGVVVRADPGTLSTFQGIRWGDVGTQTSGEVVYEYIDWEHPGTSGPIIRAERPSDVVGSATVITLPDGIEPEFEYNPKQKGTDLIYSSTAEDSDAMIAQLVEESVDELIEENWTATKPSDRGSWGKAVSNRVRDKINGFSAIGEWWRGENWRTGVLVENETGEIVRFDAPGGIADHTEIDVLQLEPGYNPVEGDVLDQSKIIVYEIKSSADGKIPANQLARLRQIQGGDIKKIWTRVKWKQSTNTLVPNKRYQKTLDTMHALGVRKLAIVATTASAVVAFAGVEDAFADFEVELLRLKDLSNPDQIILQESVVVVKLKNLIDAVSGGTAEEASAIALLKYVYEVLIPRLGQPHWQPE